MGTPDTHIRIPRKLYELINKLVVQEGYYRSAAEFILECTRNRVEEIKRNRIDQRKIRALEKENTGNITPKGDSGMTHPDSRISKSD
jgi:Arc/MetJ-type ribon-helix-helix transcriptional regulator